MITAERWDRYDNDRKELKRLSPILGIASRLSSLDTRRLVRLRDRIMWPSASFLRERFMTSSAIWVRVWLGSGTNCAVSSGSSVLSRIKDLKRALLASVPQQTIPWTLSPARLRRPVAVVGCRCVVCIVLMLTSVYLFHQLLRRRNSCDCPFVNRDRECQHLYWE